MLNLLKLKNFARLNTTYSWYTEFCRLYDNESPIAAGKWLKTLPLFTVLQRYIDYYDGKPGYPLKSLETFTLRFPEIENTCIRCGNPTKWQPANVRWSPTCGLKCSNIMSGDKRIATCVRLYGVANVSQSTEINAKRKRTFQERYGVDNPYQVESVKEKIKNVNLERYGVENVSSSKEIQMRKEQTSIENFGVSHWTKDANMQAAKEHPFTQRTLIKGRKTFFLKHGVRYPMQVPEILAKSNATMLERYECNSGTIPNGYRIKNCN